MNIKITIWIGICLFIIRRKQAAINTAIEFFCPLKFLKILLLNLKPKDIGIYNEISVKIKLVKQ